MNVTWAGQNGDLYEPVPYDASDAELRDLVADYYHETLKQSPEALGYLEKRGVTHCGDMEKLPVSELGRRFGNIGRRIWFMAQGLDPEPVITEVADPKSIGHGKVMLAIEDEDEGRGESRRGPGQPRHPEGDAKPEPSRRRRPGTRTTAIRARGRSRPP